MNAVDHQPDEGLEADERALIEATLSLLQLDGAWPSFDELDKYADNRLGIPNAGEALTRISPSIVRGLHGLASIPGDRSVELTARAVALCPDGAELALAFTHAVAAAARTLQICSEIGDRCISNRHLLAAIAGTEVGTTPALLQELGTTAEELGGLAESN